MPVTRAGVDGPTDLRAPEDVLWIARTLRKAGFDTWAVGGAVRDALAGRAPGDWDLATAARPGDVRRLFRRTVPVGIEHGTVGVFGRDGRLYEVTTFRRDVETFGRKARVIFADDLDEDLERRDFTINAVAWNPVTLEVRDPHGGRADLSRGVLRTVGDPDQRFLEDRLRVLRAMRFAGRFDLEIEPATWEAIRRAAGELGNLSPERIREELIKTLSGQDRPSRTLDLYARSGVLAHLYPELEATRPSGDWDMLLRAADAASRSRPLIRLAALLHQARPAPSEEVSGESGGNVAARSAAAAREVLRRLRSSNVDTDKVTHLIAQLDGSPVSEAPPAEIRRWVRRIGGEYLRDHFRLRIAVFRAADPKRADQVDQTSDTAHEIGKLWGRARSIQREGVPLSIGELAIDGEDLRRLGIPPGPLYGQILRRLLEEVTDDPELNQPDRLLEIARKSV